VDEPLASGSRNARGCKRLLHGRFLLKKDAEASEEPARDLAMPRVREWSLMQ
jgi:hypothetical protein